MGGLARTSQAIAQKSAPGFTLIPYHSQAFYVGRRLLIMFRVVTTRPSYGGRWQPYFLHRLLDLNASLPSTCLMINMRTCH